jgi:two-component system, OmpR family, response regulator
MTTKAKPEPAVIKKILVVEDDGEIGLVLDMVLHSDHLQLDYVDSLSSADEYLQKEQPSIIILDNKLPDGFGIDFISYIRQKYPAIKIIMISGLGAARDVALSNGADVFFEKPFSLEEINEAISKLM